MRVPGMAAFMRMFMRMPVPMHVVEGRAVFAPLPVAVAVTLRSHLLLLYPRFLPPHDILFVIGQFDNSACESFDAPLHRCEYQGSPAPSAFRGFVPLRFGASTNYKQQ
jgi:hypothetical protein